MTISFTIPMWLLTTAIPGWLAIGVLTFYVGGALYAWYGIDQKPLYRKALVYQWARVDRLGICVILWPWAFVEIYRMFRRRWDKDQWDAGRYVR
jgi:hypothetical protein